MRKGFVLRAVVRAWRALGGQIRVISVRVRLGVLEGWVFGG